MNKQLIEVLFNSKSGRAFTPVTTEDGKTFTSAMQMKSVMRFGRVDLSHEGRPDYFLNVVLIRDVTEKLLGHMAVMNELKLPELAMQYIQDEDYGFMVCVDDAGEVQAAFYVELYAKQTEPMPSLIQRVGHDREYIVNALVTLGYGFTDFEMPQGSKPPLRLV
jgi:hypothetical protein